jgi:hypothetical protein
MLDIIAQVWLSEIICGNNQNLSPLSEILCDMNSIELEVLSHAFLLFLSSQGCGEHGSKILLNLFENGLKTSESSVQFVFGHEFLFKRTLPLSALKMLISFYNRLSWNSGGSLS